MKKRTVVTGIGILSPLGIGTDASWQACKNGCSGIGAITKFDPVDHPTRIAGQVDEFDRSEYLDSKEIKRYDEFTQYALVAAGMAVKDAGLEITPAIEDRTGVILGTGIGGFRTIEANCKSYIANGPSKVSPFFIPMSISNMAAGVVARRYKIQGPNHCVVTACAAGTHAIGEAFKVIQSGRADVMLTGGTEACLTGLVVAGFNAMKALSRRNEDPKRASRPFDNERDGFVPAEGAATLILEEFEYARKRNAKIYAEILGYGLSCDAYHFSAPDPDGIGASLCMRMALNDAEINPSDVDYINAHGTSTRLNDQIETKAIKTVFKDHAGKLAVSSTKSMTGHLLGAAGAVEAGFTCLALKDGVIPPTINYETPDPDCDLDYVPNEAREVKFNIALSNSFGFGGTNASLIFQKMNGNGRKPIHC